MLVATGMPVPVSVGEGPAGDRRPLEAGQVTGSLRCAHRSGQVYYSAELEV